MKTPRLYHGSHKRSRRIGRIACVAILAGICSVPALAQQTYTEPQWVPGRLLVKPRPGLSESEFEKIIKPSGGRQVGKIQGIDVRIIQLPAQASEKAVEALLKHNKHLKFVERDFILKSGLTPSDPYLANAWHLPKIGVNSAWDLSQGQNVTIAILDSGVDGTHPDLAAKMVPGWNFYDNNADTTDVYGHGTQVAGAAAAITGNALGVASPAGAAKIMPIRVTNLTGGGYTSMMASGLIWAADRGVRVANLSFQAAGGISVVQTAAQYMKNKGGLVVTAAGNTGTDLSAYYAASPTNIVVSATGSLDTLPVWSSYGVFVDVAAPGLGIWTTAMGGTYYNPSGTSFATPVTAGVVAMMMAANPKLDPDTVEKLLFSTAVDLGSAGFDIYYGNGRVDAAAAVKAAAAALIVDTTAPTVAFSTPTALSTVSGQTTVDVSASDNLGVARVDLLANGTKVASESIAPYAFTWDSTTVPDGAATLATYAYDAAGNFSAKSISVTVANQTQTTETLTPVPPPPAADTTAPVAKISSPAAGATVSGTVSVSASASDNVGVTKMLLYIDGKLLSSVTKTSLVYSWSTKKVSVGPHVILIEAYDAAGNKGVVTATVNVTR